MWSWIGRGYRIPLFNALLMNLLLIILLAALGLAAFRHFNRPAGFFDCS